MKIPDDWQIASLGSLGDWKGGGTPSKSRQEYWNGNIPWASPKDFKGVVLSETEDSITPVAIERSSTSLIAQGSIIFVTRSGILRHKVPVAVNTVSIAINQDLKALNTYSDYCALFVFYSVQAFNDEIRKQTVKTGTTVESIDFQALKKFEIPLPPTLTEQRAIATALSDVDRLLAAYDQLIAKKKAIKQGVMQELLTGRRRLEGFEGENGFEHTELGPIPKDWNIWPLKECLETPPRYGINAPAVSFSENLPQYLRITDISDSGQYIKEGKVSVNHLDSSSYLLSEGDLVLARTGASVGKSYLYNQSDGVLVYAGFLIKIRPDQSKLLPSYLKSYLGTDNYWNWVSIMSVRSGQPGINGAEYGELKIPLPPTIHEQRAIAQILTDMDAEIAALEQQRDKYKAVKAGMMQELLTGKTRLI